MVPLCLYRTDVGRYKAVFEDEITVQLTGDRHQDLVALSQQMHDRFEKMGAARARAGLLGAEKVASQAIPKTSQEDRPVKLTQIGEFGFIDPRRCSGNRETRRRSQRDRRRLRGESRSTAPDYLLITTDLLVERVHFMLDWAEPEIIGVKSLEVNLSDIAACGGTPRDAFISLAIPPYIRRGMA